MRIGFVQGSRNGQGRETKSCLSLNQEIVVKHKEPYGLDARHKREHTYGFQCPVGEELKIRDWA